MLLFFILRLYIYHKYERKIFLHLTYPFLFKNSPITFELQQFNKILTFENQKKLAALNCY